MSQISDAFVITLPSNASMQTYTKNRPSNYVVQLPNYVDLSGNWEVAATDIQFSHEWYNLPKDYVLGVNVYHREQKHTPRNSFDTPQDIELNRWREQEPWGTTDQEKFKYRAVMVKRGNYTSFRELGQHICGLITAAVTEVYPEPFKVDYVYDATKKTAEFIPKAGFVIRFSTQSHDLMKILGIESTQQIFVGGKTTPSLYFYGTMPITVFAGSVKDYSKDKITTANAVPEDLPDLRTIFVYSDIADYQIVGDVKAQLLGVVPVNNRPGERTNWTFNPPMYSSVATNSFNSIKIWLTDHCGEEVKFSNTSDFIVARLHFKPRRI